MPFWYASGTRYFKPSAIFDNLNIYNKRTTNMSHLTIKHAGNQPNETWEAPNATKEEKQAAALKNKNKGVLSKLKGFFKK